MKNLALFLLISLCFSISGVSQFHSDISSESEINKQFYFGVGFGFGIFYPSDVNDYIAASTSDIDITEGVTDLFLNYVGRLSLTYRPNRVIDFSLIAEYAWSPKLVVVDDGSIDYFHFDRFSPGMLAKLHIPVGSGRHSIFMAPGLLINNMKFEEFKASSVGPRLEAGFNFNFGKTTLQPFVCFDYAKAVDDFNGYNEFELNYTGVQIGVDFSF
ncbi:MAG: hypothetical protein K9H64_14790 [Bacteroidales bacterium]|nr:hypothetical protein [Bacteroidales bacterium]MCF8457233.1 hypothetical protein [Bacteroidales bacterium]